MYKTILVPIDLDQESSWRQAFPVARAMIGAFGGHLHVLTVLPVLQTGLVGSYFPPDFEDKARAAAEQRLEEIVAAELANLPGKGGIGCHVALGSIDREILDAARNVSADLIVMASHRPELKDYLIGPNAARVVRHAPISVLVVRG